MTLTKVSVAALTLVSPLVWGCTSSAHIAVPPTTSTVPIPHITEPSSPSAVSSLRRPLHLPPLEAGAACSTSHGRSVSPAFSAAFGPGPVYAVGLGADALAGARVEGGWYYVKVLWVAQPGLPGPFLVRGERIDGPGEVRFQDGPNPSSELPLIAIRDTNGAQIPATAFTPGQDGWTTWPTYTRVRGSGCYAFQVDGPAFSIAIVFTV